MNHIRVWTVLLGTMIGMPALADEPAPANATTMSPSTASTDFDLFSKNTVSVLADWRLAVANGATSFVNGGFGKTRLQGDGNGGFSTIFAPFEADVVWNPRLGKMFSANVSGAWQRGHHDGFDLMEAFLNFLPDQSHRFRFSGRMGLMWPEISLEHSTGGAWSVVNTITPSVINSWVGEEVKVLGTEISVHTNLGDHDFGLTGGVFGWDDTSGTLLSFRGWALNDIKSTALGSFRLPPLNNFITLLQQHKTDNTIEIDHQPGWYARLDWHPPQPVDVALFYYDNRGNPQAFTAADQWGWRTRFWNLSVNVRLGRRTKLLAQGMTGSTIMGFPENGRNWVHTDFRSAYVLIVHDFGPLALTGRIEGFQTREHGSEMPPSNNEDGWAATVAARVPIDRYFTAFIEAMNVNSRRGTRVALEGLASPFESQAVFQISLRAKI
ncbi:hypothetical protein HLH36_12655 [Gluconacetobacter aggeris]|uniref:Porin n=1 Tax=Gluconacetobacter aggeris TaxID=1286186 RepID=A0A7W4IUA9_9PROT|nr:hypothetical protein [Gluconacetobacter aggeris]MBB2169194.1 hypothetical protein [Gluconacetobacter aggeris]